MFEELTKRVSVEAPRSLDALPGLRYRAAAPTRLIVFVLIFSGFFLLMPLTIFQSDKGMKLSMHGRLAQAKVVSVAENRQCANEGHVVVYSFPSEQAGDVRGSTVMCGDSPYYSSKPGDSIPVKYLPSDPSVNAVASAKANEPRYMFFMFFPVLIFLVLSAAFLPQLREVARARRIFKKGKLVTGSVLFAKKKAPSGLQGWQSMATAEVYLSYRDASGKEREGVAWCANDWVLGQMAPGTDVQLIYLPEAPERVLLLAAFIR